MRRRFCCAAAAAATFKYAAIAAECCGSNAAAAPGGNVGGSNVGLKPLCPPKPPRPEYTDSSDGHRPPLDESRDWHRGLAISLFGKKKNVKRR